jgi:hypothetical protein
MKRYVRRVVLLFQAFCHLLIVSVSSFNPGLNLCRRDFLFVAPLALITNGNQPPEDAPPPPRFPIRLTIEEREKLLKMRSTKEREKWFESKYGDMLRSQAFKDYMRGKKFGAPPGPSGGRNHVLGAPPGGGLGTGDLESGAEEFLFCPPCCPPWCVF